jgi:hypothetical protein
LLNGWRDLRAELPSAMRRSKRTDAHRRHGVHIGIWYPDVELHYNASNVHVGECRETVPPAYAV